MPRRSGGARCRHVRCSSVAAMKRVARSRRQAAVALAAAALACGCHAWGSTLEDLGRRDDVHAEASFSPDQCACHCDQLICWDFTCSGPRCSRADEYELRVVHGPASGNGECLDERDEVTAKLVLDEGEPLAPKLVSNVCGTLDITWRMSAGRFDTASPHRVEISDGSTTWMIDDPFLRHTLTIVAPPTAAAPAAGQRRVVRAGETLVIGVSPPLPAAMARAALQLITGPNRPASALPVAVTDDHIAFTIPLETTPGIYDVTTSVDVMLGPDG